jgi:hypothetical protein
MAAALGSSVEEVLPVRGRTVARSHLWFWSRMGPGETGCHHGARGGGMVVGIELNLWEKEESRALEEGGGFLYEEGSGLGLEDRTQGHGGSGVEWLVAGSEGDAHMSQGWWEGLTTETRAWVALGRHGHCYCGLDAMRTVSFSIYSD